MLRLVIGAVESTLPVTGSRNHPWATKPLLSTKLPPASNLKSPARVYLYVFPLSPEIIKKPSPWIAISVVLSEF